MYVTNIEVSKLLNNIAAAYTITDEEKYRFQIIAYQKAADTIEHHPTELKELLKEDKLHDLPGVGPSIKAHLEELFTTGKVNHFEEVMNRVPPAVFPLLEVPSFGPKKAYRLVKEFNLTSPQTVIADIVNLAQAGKIRPLAGFGEKSEADILRAMEEYTKGKGKVSRMVLSYADELAQKIITYLQKEPAVIQVHPLGSLRRKKETIGDIDISVATNDPQKVLHHFISYPHKERTIEQGDKTASILVTGGKQIDLMVQPENAYGSLLQHFTGSKAHNVHLREYALSKRLSLSEYGIKKHGAKGKELRETYDTEEKFYEALGMQWVPPEMREDRGEIELAVQHKLPKLVELADIKGDFHLHSSYQIEPSHDMGMNSMEEMIEKALSLGYTILGFSEHNPSLSKHTKKEITTILEKRMKYIEQLNLKYKKFIRIFSLLETDILPNGSLAINEDALSFLDATIVSIHSVFSLDKRAMTERVLKGLSHKKAKILAHPTGRLINDRRGYELDWEKIFTFCKTNNKALEINSWPSRLDLPDILVHEAINHGVKLIINTDSHKASQMSMMKYGVSVARRGWATKGDILNTMTYNEYEMWLKK